ncbi:hypothetical protein CNMCM5793_004310 [Aspergillus hiratsukae]|uniref:GPI anchored glycoprotein n=1 Tax=Aspergillus hiratsukae TaxID=1194566 RepID=A0A8H6PS05_9EURO|nr:hypothetical protein CNMCM5793_004310 [Aspergillus hiratsukae]KAF7159277.1 hypothetical protein CNMCM6106_006412 [Aspergillus hiratsukae]
MRSNTIRSLALLTATAATVAAESTVSLFMPFADPQSLVAEVLGSSDSATTYLVNCASPGEECGMPTDGFTIVQGPSTLQQTYSYNDYYAAYGCKLGGTTSISCQITQSDSTTTHVAATAMTESIASFFLPVVVTGTATAGAPATTGASVSAGTASATATGSASATGKTTLATGPSASGTQATASASTSHSSSGNAAMPQITGNANWAIGGAAMAMAVALA